ncbi:type I-E CRISPR-associated endonuclease Cas1e [Actinoplanes teichomyceticus]|uniref:CRISPR-associated endonuclease Cas1 n=1 Tax=Actinoplanes teichomyceticus TaxID=1867 RepID=A0A561VS78_ACTTI|nr:type I-E CRISPR-associated endonuclease Cas1e [Actinoplanes teichomyceticus]TWG14479.1 CRISPR-associated Cas1 family protein [Actinoplanes teichomyceticus]GIF16283.1 CRISPR-associated endonuclease Cas1 [Actinoplanes teichomyceticus]
MNIPGVPPPQLPELTRAQDRISFLYLERCVIHRDANAITAADDKGVVHIPAATLSVLLLGPGTSITHQAMTLIADNGATAIWVGERGVRYYAHGRSLARSSRLLIAQAAAVSDRTRRLNVARTMYSMRFPGEDTARLTMQQLRGKEGARVRRCYREHSKRTGVPWNQRDYNPDDFASGDRINQALSAAHACLYGVVHAAIVAIGASPGLGFVHTGHERSFVYDIADLYKAEVTIPVAFDIAASDSTDIGADTRRAVRDRVHDGAILDRCVRDIRALLLTPQSGAIEEDWLDADEVNLWDESGADIPAGFNHGSEYEVDF